MFVDLFTLQWEVIVRRMEREDEDSVSDGIPLVQQAAAAAVFVTVFGRSRCVRIESKVFVIIFVTIGELWCVIISLVILFRRTVKTVVKGFGLLTVGCNRYIICDTFIDNVSMYIYSWGGGHSLTHSCFDDSSSNDVINAVKLWT